MAEMQIHDDPVAVLPAGPVNNHLVLRKLREIAAVELVTEAKHEPLARHIFGQHRFGDIGGLKLSESDFMPFADCWVGITAVSLVARGSMAVSLEMLGRPDFTYRFLHGELDAGGPWPLDRPILVRPGQLLKVKMQDPPDYPATVIFDGWVLEKMEKAA